MKREQNLYLQELNSIYDNKLDILKSPFYDRETLENSLKRYILADCIEYREYGIEAYEILSLHEKLLQITLEEKKLMHEIEVKNNMRMLPKVHQEVQDKENDLKVIQSLYERQKKVHSS